MHDTTTMILDRLFRVLTERIRPAVHTVISGLTVHAWHVDGGQGEPVPVSAALAARYEPFRVGQEWGPAWGTTWFHLTGNIPADLAATTLEVVLDLGWADHSPGFQAEGLVHRPDGTVIKGLNPRNGWVPIEARPGGQVDLYVEAAANPMIQERYSYRPTNLGEKSTAGDAPRYRLARADICDRNLDVWELVADLEVLDGLAKTLPTNDPRRHDVLFAVERALDRLGLADIVGRAAAARAELEQVLAQPAGRSAHRLSAVGHAHIDSAWLWPVRETVRKVARTTANVVQLMSSNPDLVYAMSSAQQYQWLEEYYPEIFAQVAERVRAGRFVPVGGMWVESDTNMVGGEALARQFIHGKRYFLDRFGVECREVWLPDSFGYSAALPQIADLAGCTWMLTQKISWNTINAFPHHSFLWEGIDGTRVFTHFPPVDTYNSDLSGGEIAHAVENFRDHGSAHSSLVPFGWGDGGGGPTREMIARARRTADLEGSARVKMESPADFFAAAQAEYAAPPVWVGELYLEIHRGTYTSQAKTKQGNRRSEHLLREAELWSATAAIGFGLPYPYDELDRIWKLVLLQQFHDILPGSAIAWVHREAVANYAALARDLELLIDAAIDVLAGGDATGRADGVLEFNASPFVRHGVAGLAAGAAEPPGPPVTATQTSAGVVLDNGLLRIQIDAQGTVRSILDLPAGREVVPAGQRANLLQLHPDLPNQWDAWDLDAHYRNAVTDLLELDALDVSHDQGAVRVRITRSFGDSVIVQLITLAPGARQIDCAVDVQWHERETLLKVAFPVDVHTDHADFEIQFGHLTRPTHQNTSWDAARFEVSAHRWVHVEEPGYGVAVVNDSTYGHDVTRHPAAGGGTSSTVRLSLLRAPRYPDPQTDQGHHHLRYALVPGATIPDSARAGYAINLPPRIHRGTHPVEPLVAVNQPGAAIIEAVKLAEDRSGDVVVRLYEPTGGRARIVVSSSFAFRRVSVTDLLERDVDAPETLSHIDAPNSSVSVDLRPFQIVTLRFGR